MSIGALVMLGSEWIEMVFNTSNDTQGRFGRTVMAPEQKVILAMILAYLFLFGVVILLHKTEPQLLLSFHGKDIEASNRDAE